MNYLVDPEMLEAENNPTMVDTEFESEYTISDYIQDMPPKLSILLPRKPTRLCVLWIEDGDSPPAQTRSCKCLSLINKLIQTHKGVSKSSNWPIRELTKCVHRGIQHYGITCKSYMLLQFRASMSIKKTIVSALHLFAPGSQHSMLVQFWEPVIVGGQCVLTTSNQPFAVNRMFDSGFLKYRKHCQSYQFHSNGVGGGVIGRVFRDKQMESTPDIEYYSEEEYPQRDFALKCGVRRCLVVPVFDHWGRNCVGVLELAVNLKSSCQFRSQMEEGLHCTLSEINLAMNAVCTTHHLPLTQTWINRKSCNSSDLSCTEVFSTVYSAHEDYHVMSKFNTACSFHHVRKGQGVVGRASSSRDLCLCRDIAQLSITDYPLAHYASKYGLTACFAICLRNTCSFVDHEYVVEFFLPPINTIYGDLKILVESLLTTMKNHFHSSSMNRENVQSFAFASGKELGAELLVEVVRLSPNDELDSFKICQTSTHLHMPESLQNGREAVNLSILQNQQFATQNVVNDRCNVFGAEQNKVAATRFNKISRAVTLEREYRTTRISFSYEILEKHFGMNLDEAAKSLGISRSSLKRECRKHGIATWPSSKKGKSKCMFPSNQGGNERTPELAGRRDPSCLGRAKVVARRKSNATPVEDVSTVAIKVTYRDDVIKFRISFLSGMSELVQNITKRLSLKEGTFRVKYWDDDDDCVLLACDEDLRNCINSWRSLSGKKAIRMVIDAK
ncbi:hypothetical protein LguiA_034417 [Lonicera macranthoides]